VTEFRHLGSQRYQQGQINKVCNDEVHAFKTEDVLTDVNNARRYQYGQAEYDQNIIGTAANQIANGNIRSLPAQGHI
jgi:hypothetical protein